MENTAKPKICQTRYYEYKKNMHKNASCLAKELSSSSYYHYDKGNFRTLFLPMKYLLNLNREM